VTVREDHMRARCIPREVLPLGQSLQHVREGPPLDVHVSPGLLALAHFLRAEVFEERGDGFEPHTQVRDLLDERQAQGVVVPGIRVAHRLSGVEPGPDLRVPPGFLQREPVVCGQDDAPDAEDGVVPVSAGLVEESSDSHRPIVAGATSLRERADPAKEEPGPTPQVAPRVGWRTGFPSGLQLAG
jgi:hypothetical protein